MAFTKPKITHKFTNADGTAASGSVRFTLEKRMTNGNETITPSTISVSLNTSGELSDGVHAYVELTANTDPGTTPEDASWRMDWHILGAEPETFTIIVPTGGGTVTLASLLPTSPLGG